MPGSGLKLGPDSLLPLWKKLGGSACGKWLFSKLAGRAIPYTGSISPRVDVLRKGHAEVLMKDKRAVRNHLNSIHAIALANLGEFSTGLSVVTSLPPGARAILKSLHVEYPKKARGTLRAVAHLNTALPETGPLEQQSVVVNADLFDTSGDCVSKVTAEWIVGSKKA